MSTEGDSAPPPSCCGGSMPWPGGRTTEYRVAPETEGGGRGAAARGGRGVRAARAGPPEPRVDALGRLPGAVGQARDEDVVGPAVLLDVDDGAGAVAGHLAAPQADHVGRP